MSTLELGMIGNCAISALIDAEARIVWSCLPRFDGDPVFHCLLGSRTGSDECGTFAFQLDGFTRSEQSYLPNTAVLRTILHSTHGSLEVIDFAPRFEARGRMFRPQTLIRRIRPIAGTPRVRVRLRPRFSYGAEAPVITRGSNHVRYVGPQFTLRLTTDAPVDYIVEEQLFNVSEPFSFVLGPDETLTDGASQTAREFEEQTVRYWRAWTHRLAIPFEWQDAVIRAAITLKMCTYEPTGAIVAAMTTSIPEAFGTVRNWDYRFCWVRDAYFVVRALNGLSAVRTMENYVSWLMNIVADAKDGHIQPVYGVAREQALVERIVESLPGYRGNGPVRIGNQAYEHYQHDTYGNIVLGAAQAFLDRRMLNPPSQEDFVRLEAMGTQAVRLSGEPDAGMWELRNRARIHTTSSLMCWAGCDRLARIAEHFGLADRARHWRREADRIRAMILERSWNEKRQAFAESFEGESLDAGVLLMSEVGIIDARDPRFVSTVAALEKTLGRGAFMMRYEAPDDFGLPETAFNVCAFWRVDALARMGRTDEAREHFESLLSSRNRLGLMSEDTDTRTGELWGNFPQTYSMVGIINGALRLSRPWESVI
jgi:GH15 family glucan-1,4-alpha-glucosidase